MLVQTVVGDQSLQASGSTIRFSFFLMSFKMMRHNDSCREKKLALSVSCGLDGRVACALINKCRAVQYPMIALRGAREASTNMGDDSGFDNMTFIFRFCRVLYVPTHRPETLGCRVSLRGRSVRRPSTRPLLSRAPSSLGCCHLTSSSVWQQSGGGKYIAAPEEAVGESTHTPTRTHKKMQ